jgi:hypothetical protein
MTNITEVAKLQDEVSTLRAEAAKVRKMLNDPAAVWINMLRGTIARPRALEHYEELKNLLETHSQSCSLHKTPPEECNCWLHLQDKLTALQMQYEVVTTELERQRDTAVAALAARNAPRPCGECKHCCHASDSWFGRCLHDEGPRATRVAADFGCKYWEATCAK